LSGKPVSAVFSASMASSKVSPIERMGDLASLSMTWHISGGLRALAARQEVDAAAPPSRRKCVMQAWICK
jgi:hypothetical protein